MSRVEFRRIFSLEQYAIALILGPAHTVTMETVVMRLADGEFMFLSDHI